MTSLAKAGTIDGTGLATVKEAVPSAKVDGASTLAQDEADDESGRLNERIEKRIMDIETGKVKMKRYTIDEHVRYLDEMLGG